MLLLYPLVRQGALGDSAALAAREALPLEAPRPGHSRCCPPTPMNKGTRSGTFITCQKATAHLPEAVEGLLTYRV